MFSMALDRRTLWMALFAGVMLVFLVLLVQRYQSASAQDAAIEYAENDTGPVATYTAVDPEGESIVWSLLENVSADDDGRLRHQRTGCSHSIVPPDFEAPTGGGDRGTDNTYVVTVQASDGGDRHDRYERIDH